MRLAVPALFVVACGGGNKPAPEQPTEPVEKKVTRGPIEDESKDEPVEEGVTFTKTSISCVPPPRITPRSGTTSAKSAPQPRVM